MFYSNLYRRHLLDMHIEDWDPAFLSKFSPETYVENLKKAQINYAMIYLQSHVGLCYYPTKTGTMHAALEKRPDVIRRLVDLCHENGIRVCGYYSLIHNTEEHDKHLEWQMLQANGKSRRVNSGETAAQDPVAAKVGRYGLCCPNNPDYRAFVHAQIDEMLDYFDVDAMFFDMPYWSHTCHCEHCRTAFGAPIPANENDRTLVEFKIREMGGFIRGITDHVKARRLDMPVEHNFAGSIAFVTAAGVQQEVLDACDYVGGDLYGDLYNHSFSCKFFRNASKNQPFEQMFSRCKPALAMHTLTKTSDEMKTALASTLQHHGATLVIDAIDPVGTMDVRVYERIGEVFEFQKPYEPYFTGAMVEEIGLYYSLRSNRGDRKYSPTVCCAAVNKTLVRAHIPFGVTGTFHTLDGYRTLVVPMLDELEDRDDARLTAYVENGGTLYLSGCNHPTLVQKLTGNRCVGVTQETNVYIAPVEGCEKLFGDFNGAYPLPFNAAAPVVEESDAQVLATLTLPYTRPDELRFASIHSDPPGTATKHPAVTVNRYGKGRVIWSALPIEAMPYEEYRAIFLNLLHMDAEQDYFFVSDAPPHVELTAFTESGRIRLNVVALDEEAVSRPVTPFEVRVRGEASAVKLLPQGGDVPFEVQDGYTVFRTRTLHILDMYELMPAE